MMFGAWALWVAMFNSGDAPMAPAWRFGLPLLILLMGFGLTRVDIATRVIELTPTTATFMGRHGFVFYQRVVLKRRSKLRFAGSTQSAWTMDRHQGLPNYVLSATGGFTMQGKRLMFMCTPAQGAWIRDALAYWATGAAPGGE